MTFPPGPVLDVPGASQVIADLLAVMHRAGVVRQVATDTDGNPGYRINAGALLWVPGVGASYGLGGAVHAAAAILAVRTLQHPDTRVLGLLVAGGLLVKLRLERAWAVPIGFDSGWAFNVIYAAHLTGAVAGAALALLLEACHRLFGRRPPRAAVD